MDSVSEVRWTSACVTGAHLTCRSVSDTCCGVCVCVCVCSFSTKLRVHLIQKQDLSLCVSTGQQPLYQRSGLKTGLQQCEGTTLLRSKCARARFLRHTHPNTQCILRLPDPGCVSVRQMIPSSAAGSKSSVTHCSGSNSEILKVLDFRRKELLLTPLNMEVKKMFQPLMIAQL